MATRGLFGDVPVGNELAGYAKTLEAMGQDGAVVSPALLEDMRAGCAPNQRGALDNMINAQGLSVGVVSTSFRL